MELSAEQQIFEQLKKSNSVLIALPEQLTVDAVASGMGLALFLRKLGKQAVVASAGSLPAVSWSFLPEAATLRHDLRGGDLLIRLNTSRHDLDQLSYRVVGQQVHVFLKAKTGVFVPDDVQVTSQAGNFDVVVTLGSAALDDLGTLYQDNADIFMNAPKINIDIRSSNEYFGASNLVDVTVSSLGELLARTLGKYEAGDTIDGEIATALLAGIISKTHSFQQPQTTPATLTTAADLIRRGARQQDIIVGLYKTKDFSLLKLWGRALARLKTSEEFSLLYTSLNATDFERTASGPDMLVPILREFIDNTSGFQIIAVLSELSGHRVRMVIAAPPHVALTELARHLGSAEQQSQPLRGIHNYVSFDLSDLDLPRAEAQLLEALAKK